MVPNCSSLPTKTSSHALTIPWWFQHPLLCLQMLSLLRARWGKVNSLGIWRMKGVFLWLRTKCNGSLSPISQTCTGLFVGELHHAISCLWAFWVGTFTSLCRNPNSSCILAQQTEISLCLVQSISLINWNLPYHQIYQNLPSNEGVTYSPPPPFFFSWLEMKVLG